MKRISAILPILAFAIGVNAQAQGQTQPHAQAQSYSRTSKFDQKLLSLLQTGNPSDTVQVILQSHDLASLQGKLSSLHANKVINFATFPGIAAQLRLGQLLGFANDPAIDAISSDEPVETSSTITGIEAVNNSSGALAALQQFGTAGDGVGVAIVDSGISTKTVALPNIVYSADFTNAPAKDDPYGHGTHVAGIVGGSGSDVGPARTYAGVAPNARLIDLRVLDGTGAGTVSSVISAIDWAIANRNIKGKVGKPLNIRVINLSLGHLPQEGAETDPLAVECRKAVQAGLVVVASAGNYGRDTYGNTVYGAILTPGIEPSVITVGAATTWGTPSRADDVVASYSSRGPTIDNIVKPDIVAPGSRIISVTSPKSYLVTNSPDLKVDPNYMILSGTSTAAPVVSGTVAMILSKVPGLTPNAVKAILMYTAENRGNPLDWGAGYLNDIGAMELATSINPAVPVCSYWLNSSGNSLSYDLINGYGVPWGQTIVWGDSTCTGNSLYFNKSAWDQTIVWANTIVWGETIVWQTNDSGAEANLSAQTIVWGQTIVWSNTIAWGNTIVWAITTDNTSAQ